MLSNTTFLETRIQRLFDGLIFFPKKRTWCACAAHSQMSRVLYTDSNFKQNVWEMGTLFTIMICEINDLMPNYVLLKFLIRSLLA